MSLLIPLLASQSVRPISVYVVPHQDDETTLAAAVLDEAAQGRDVYILLTTRGESSAARTNPALTGPLGYTPTKEEFSAARDREFSECVRRLGATPVVLTWGDRESDGSSVLANVIAMVKAIFPPTVALRATGPTDYHHDHRTCGEAVQALAAQGWGTDHKLFLAPTFLHLAPPGVTMTKWGEHGDLTEWHCWSYIDQDIPNDWWGVGYISAASSFDYFLNVDGAAYWHAPLEE